MSSKGFLERWSRLKRGAGDAESRARASAVDIARAQPALPDPETLDSTSDYRCFLSSDVPDELRVRALRKLWQSDASLSQGDGLIDYAGDYSDDHACSGAAITTAFRIGQGLLSDEEAAQWSSLGLPEESCRPEENDAPSDESPDGDDSSGEPSSSQRDVDV